LPKSTVVLFAGHGALVRTAIDLFSGQIDLGPDPEAELSAHIRRYTTPGDLLSTSPTNLK